MDRPAPFPSRLPQNGAAPQAGGVDIRANVLAKRVHEIVTARVKQPFTIPPPVMERVAIAYRGKDAQEVDVAFVLATVERCRWGMATSIRMLGFDMDRDGTLEVGEGEPDSSDASCSQAYVPLIWKHKDYVEPPSAPKLSVVK